MAAEHQHRLPKRYLWGDCAHLDGTPGVPQIKSGFVHCDECDQIIARGCLMCGVARRV